MVANESVAHETRPQAVASWISLSFVVSAILAGTHAHAQPQPPHHSAEESRPSRVLYYEGSPRHEFGFLRRAVADAPDLELVGAVRLRPGHLLRLGVADNHELRDGFPAKSTELSRYDAIVLGDIEAGAFSPAQLELIVEFVRRGGGLLLLGGATSFTAGDWKESLLEPLLPVDLFNEYERRAMPLGKEGKVETPTQQLQLQVEVMRTGEGAEHPALMPATEGADPFEGLPQLTVPVAVAGARWEALPLLEGESAEGERATVLAVRSFGNGRSAVLTVQDTWRWQMLAPLDDDRHERFWLTLLRWLAGRS